MTFQGDEHWAESRKVMRVESRWGKEREREEEN